MTTRGTAPTSDHHRSMMQAPEQLPCTVHPDILDNVDRRDHHNGYGDDDQLRRRSNDRSSVRSVLSLVRAVVRLRRERRLITGSCRPCSSGRSERTSRQFPWPPRVPTAPRRHPASLEEHPRIVDLLRDGEMLARLRRVHQAFGEALRKEHVSREIDSLDQ